MTMAQLLDFSKPHLLRNESEYNLAIEEIDQLLDADPPNGSAEYDRLEFLSVLVEDYEDRHYPFGEDVTPQEAVTFMLEQKGLDRGDLTEWLGGRSRVSEFFSGKRPLSKTQIETLRTHLGISADLLLG
jgi:HTH-type transcriptional regulator / antitoxin HigA